MAKSKSPLEGDDIEKLRQAASDLAEHTERLVDWLLHPPETLFIEPGYQATLHHVRAALAVIHGETPPPGLHDRLRPE